MTKEEDKSLESIFKAMDIAPDVFYPTFKAGYQFALAVKQDKIDKFLSYLDQQIENSDRHMQEQSYDLEAVEYCKGQKDAYLAMQEKYTQLINQP